MSDRTLARTRGDLSNFLIHHRTKLKPTDVGLSTTGRRRTAGLRREEVAALAGVGLTWYTWFEQGRDIQVSEDFLLKVAKALKLNDIECSHLFLLAHRRPPPPEAWQWPSVSPLIQQLLADITVRPAYVINLRWDIIAWNTLADHLFGFSSLKQVNRNIIRMVFTDPEFRCRLPAWHEDAPKLLSQFRRDLASVPNESDMLSLVTELKELSSDFRRWTEQPSIESYSRGFSIISDEDDEKSEYVHEMLIVDEHRHLKMIVHFKKKLVMTSKR
ncbi:helix-turn-helix transcriptional regulator [Xenorhabdus hominickii]|uniref:Transcriptional regulator n=1 Tax=Xenorhabdus hominickii TaxID=351679 RepID=A0A2G0QDQ7_XENHO|nr:helix-turn-helix transcriptional regulator [Xenorhabdus hominickii]AOM41425.1 transcriptional regulator [Xenorhabdus hominickii]PHM57341.1 transcriptional regulator [Xenorhabdus hominickii]